MKDGRSLQPQPWDWPRPRVLLELPDRGDREARIDALRIAGSYPLADDEVCPAPHGADVVVSGLGLDTPEGREPLIALRTRLPHLPVLVEADAEATARWPELVREDERLEPGAGPAELVEGVRKALGKATADA
jgi:hypothetical protein